MYDLEGSDTDREWVEVFNSGASSVSLSGWRLYENDSNHKLTLIQGSESISSGEYAVIVDDASTFLLDWPEFSGIVLDSSFSLHNSGEQLIIRDGELIDIDSVTYSSEWGAKGDGNSLYYTGSDWLFGIPSPGSGPLSAAPDSQTQGDNNQTESNTQEPSVGSSFPVEPQIFAHITAPGANNTIVTVGADSLFKGRAIGLSGEPLSGARFLWSFGDGGRAEGESVLYHYKYPGEYITVLNVSSGKYSAAERIVVSARSAHIQITYADKDRIEVSNESSREINLSWWVFMIGSDSFVIPQDTIMLPGQTVSFSSEITGLFPENKSDVVLLYPNMMPVSLITQNTQKDIPNNISKATISNDNVLQQSIIGKVVSVPLANTDTIVSRQEEGDQSNEASESIQLASVSKASSSREENRYSSWLTLIGVILLGSVSVLFLRKKSREEITIID